MSPFGRIFLSLGVFLSEKYRPIFGGKSFYLLRAMFGQNWAIFFAKHLVTLTATVACVCSAVHWLTAKHAPQDAAEKDIFSHPLLPLLKIALCRKKLDEKLSCRGFVSE
jgi:hypothetical protein